MSDLVGNPKDRFSHDVVHIFFLIQLHPSDTAIIDYSKKEMSDAKQYARKLLVVSLSDKGGEEKKKEEDTVKIDLVGIPLFPIVFWDE